MSALDHAREVLARTTSGGGNRDAIHLRAALAALVAECEECRTMVAFSASAFESGENGAPVLRAFLAKLKGGPA